MTAPTQDVHAPFITVYLPIAGWKAVMLYWNPEGFWEPWETTPIAFPTREAAVAWGKDWAEEEGIEFCDPDAIYVIVGRLA